MQGQQRSLPTALCLSAVAVHSVGALATALGVYTPMAFGGRAWPPCKHAWKPTGASGFAMSCHAMRLVWSLSYMHRVNGPAKKM